jgi:RNA-binding protein
MSEELTGKQRRKLRALGHHLTVVVQVGQKGITPELVAAVEQALTDHELVKVKLSADAVDDRHAAAEALAEQTGSALAQVIGRTVLLYKKRKKNPKIVV